MFINIEKRFVIEEYDGKKNVDEWIKRYEKERLRLRKTNEAKKVECLRFFLEGSAMNWYDKLILSFFTD